MLWYLRYSFPHHTCSWFPAFTCRVFVSAFRSCYMLPAPKTVINDRWQLSVNVKLIHDIWNHCQYILFTQPIASDERSVFFILLFLLPGNIYSSGTFSATLLSDMVFYSRNGSIFIQNGGWIGLKHPFGWLLAVSNNHLFIFGLFSFYFLRPKGLKKTLPALLAG